MTRRLQLGTLLPPAPRLLRPGVVACAAIVAATIAAAQQSWDATVAANSAKEPAGAAVPLAAPKAKPAVEPPVPTEAKAAKVEAAAPPAKQAEAAFPPGSPAAEYCANIASAASDARFAWQKKAIAEMEAELAKRVALVEEKTAELQKWMARRDEFSKKAADTVLRIYQRLRPDAAALQMTSLDEETAASILTKLEPRVSSLILNEMDPVRAARLTATINLAGKIAPPPQAPKAASAPAKETKP